MARDAGQLVFMGNVRIVPELAGPFGDFLQIAMARDAHVRRRRTLGWVPLVTAHAIYTGFRVFLSQQLCARGGQGTNGKCLKQHDKNQEH